MTGDPRIAALPDIHGHAKGEHKPFAEERPIPYTARMLFLWFFHACRRSSPRFLMVADHINYLTFEDPAAVNLVRRALKLAQAGDLYGAAETAGVELHHAATVSEGLRRGMRYSIGAEIDNDPRSRPDAQNIVDAMRPDGMIRSVHFLPINHPQHGEWMWPFDNPEFKELYDVVGTEQTWELYMTTLLEAIDKLPGNIVGHFYVPAKFGHWPSDEALERYEDRFLEACAERGMAIEVNSRYFYKYFADDDVAREKYRAVNLRLLRKAKQRGVMVAVGSDAHSPRDQGSAFDVVLELLDEAEINEIAFPINGRLARVALRATEEILRQSGSFVEPIPQAAGPSAQEPELRKGREAMSGKHAGEGAAQAAFVSNNGAAGEGAASPEPARRKRPSRAKPKPTSDAPAEAPVAVPGAALAAAKVGGSSVQKRRSASGGAGSDRPNTALPPIPISKPVAAPGADPTRPKRAVRSGASRPSGATPDRTKSVAAQPQTRKATEATGKAAAPPRKTAATVKPSAAAKTKSAPKAAAAAKLTVAAKAASKTTKARGPVAKKSSKKAVSAKRIGTSSTAKKTQPKKAARTQKAAKRSAPARRPVAKKTAVKKKPLKKVPAKKTAAKRKAKSRR